MLTNQIIMLRDKLNSELADNYIITDIVLETSQKLDALIVEYYKNILINQKKRPVNPDCFTNTKTTEAHISS